MIKDAIDRVLQLAAPYVARIEARSRPGEQAWFGADGSRHVEMIAPKSETLRVESEIAFVRAIKSGCTVEPVALVTVDGEGVAGWSAAASVRAAKPLVQIEWYESPVMSIIASWAKEAAGQVYGECYQVAAASRMLRYRFEGIAPSGLAAMIAQLSVRSTSEGGAHATRGRESIGSSIVREVEASVAAAMPDRSFPFTLKYDVRSVAPPMTIDVAVDPDLSQNGWRFAVNPCELGVAMIGWLCGVADYITSSLLHEFGEAEASSDPRAPGGIPVILGERDMVW